MAGPNETVCGPEYSSGRNKVGTKVRKVLFAIEPEWELCDIWEVVTILRSFSNSLAVVLPRECPRCTSSHVRRARRNFAERALGLIGIYPFRCQQCQRRFFALDV